MEPDHPGRHACSSHRDAAPVDGYSDAYFRSGNTLFFCAPVTGGTTSKSEFPRSELRETYKDGELRNWTYPEADHRMTASLSVNQVPSEGRVVIGQIHTYQGKGPLLKVEYVYDRARKTGSVIANYRLKPGSTDTKVVIVENVELNKRFTYEVRLSSAGYLHVICRIPVERRAQERLFYSFNLEDHIPANHLLRSIDQCLDLSDLRHYLADFYSPIGRPSIDPELMIRMLIVGYCYGIRSERRLCEEAHLNLAYRWFCRLSLEDEVPNHSTFSKNRHGRRLLPFGQVSSRLPKLCR
ncbi:polysaccharide lyase family 7 protein [Pseudomonas sp. R3-56]